MINEFALCISRINAGRGRMTESLVWYLLVDSEGIPYKGASVETVYLSRTSLITQFRDKIFKKNKNILTDTTPSQLRVYASLNRLLRIPNDPEEADAIVGDLGDSKECALTVNITHESSKRARVDVVVSTSRVVDGTRKIPYHGLATTLARGNGVHLDRPHLGRQKLVQKIVALAMTHRVE